MKYSSRKFRRLEKKAGIFNALHQQVDEIKGKEDASFKKYWKVKECALHIRNQFMVKKAADLAEEKNIEVSSIIKQQIENEKSRRNNRKIKFTLNKLNKTSVTTVEVDNTDGTTKELTARHDIEAACLKENYDKYTQTETTVCM